MARAIGRSPETEARYLAHSQVRAQLNAPRVEPSAAKFKRGALGRIGLEIALFIGIALAGIGFGAALRHAKSGNDCPSCVRPMIEAKK